MRLIWYNTRLYQALLAYKAERKFILQTKIEKKEKSGVVK